MTVLSLPTEWAPLTLSAALEAGPVVPEIRLNPTTQEAELRGSAIVKTGKEVKTEDALFTIPAAFIPVTDAVPRAIVVGAPGPGFVLAVLRIGTLDGEGKAHGFYESAASVEANKDLFFTGIGWNIE